MACVQFFSGHFKWGVKIFLCVILLFFIWTGRTQPGILVNEELDEFKEAARFAQTTFPNGRFCSFGQDEEHFTYYFSQAITTFKTFEEFKNFYQQGGRVVCFAMPIHHMSIEHWKIFIVLLKNASIKTFGQINVFSLP